ncbi:hypothetical protein [Candidatus Phytoplasma meliae]|uniref:Uncharacterized protein n=1 Tax=Candidatus Phytoplasma meliae TaxID=1848402 RepID=A0ABS5CXZ3_9MOLU|nr:hypothetical protein [Candidatus Phytoplasma meliae]MBP5835837.1 hypothetical protein [Candidatus Phytoplasma meliae]
MKNNETKTKKAKLSVEQIEELQDSLSTINYLTLEEENTLYSHADKLHDFLGYENYGYEYMSTWQREQLDKLQDALATVYEVLNKIETFEIEDAIEEYENNPDNIDDDESDNE